MKCTKKKNIDDFTKEEKRIINALDVVKNWIEKFNLKMKSSESRFLLRRYENKKTKKVKINKMVENITDCERIKKIFNC